jgi:hypothetical protein
MALRLRAAMRRVLWLDGVIGHFLISLASNRSRFEVVGPSECVENSVPRTKGALTSYAVVRKRRTHETGFLNRPETFYSSIGRILPPIL